MRYLIFVTGVVLLLWIGDCNSPARSEMSGCMQIHSRYCHYRVRNGVLLHLIICDRNWARESEKSLLGGDHLHYTLKSGEQFTLRYISTTLIDVDGETFRLDNGNLFLHRSATPPTHCRQLKVQLQLLSAPTPQDDIDRIIHDQLLIIAATHPELADYLEMLK